MMRPLLPEILENPVTAGFMLSFEAEKQPILIV